MSPYAAHHAPIDRAPNVHGNADPDVMAHRRQPLDVTELALWNAAQARARAAYEDVKRRAAVPPTRRKR